MASIDPSGPNADQIAYWNGRNAQKWVAFQDSMDRMLAPLSAHAMDVAGIASGQRVVDIGCGCGGTSIELAGRVGPSGAVLGADISGPMLERARQRVAELSGHTIEFVQADASIHPFDGDADQAFSRFGVMFFQDPAAAFRNIASALKPGGRFTFICWAEASANPWRSVPIAVAARHVELPAPEAPGGPGPFSLSDEARPRTLLAEAGFMDIRIERDERGLLIGPTVESAAEHAVQLGPLGNIMRDAPAAAQDAVVRDMRAALAEHMAEDGVRLGAATWIVTARRPG